MSHQFQYSEHAPRQFPLDYWISGGTAQLAPDSTPSALRDMAWNRGQLVGLAAACFGTACSAFGAFLLVLALGGPIGMVFTFAGMGASLLGVSLALRAKANRVPKISPMMGSRAPGKFSSGLGFAAFLFLVFGAGLFPVVSPLLQEGPGHFFGFVAAYMLLLVATGSLFAAPAYFSQHARDHFRSRIAADPELRRSLESLSLTWQDPRGNRSFGPL